MEPDLTIPPLAAARGPDEATDPVAAHFCSRHPAPPDSDRPLLITLFDPSADLPATAEAIGLDVVDLAHWLDQPHIQAQVELIQSLRALQRDIWAEQLRREAAEALRESLRAPGQPAPDTAERRRCANTILRATAAPRRSSLSPKERVAPPQADHGPTRPGEGAFPSPPGRWTPGAVGLGEGVSPPPQASSISNPTHPAAHDTPPKSHPSLNPLTPVTPVTHSPLSSSSSSSSSRLSQALAALRALGYDTTEDELTDEEIDALEDARLDAELDEDLDAQLDEELDEFADSLTDADPPRRAHALDLAQRFLADRRDTS